MVFRKIVTCLLSTIVGATINCGNVGSQEIQSKRQTPKIEYRLEQRIKKRTTKEDILRVPIIIAVDENYTGFPNWDKNLVRIVNRVNSGLNYANYIRKQTSNEIGLYIEHLVGWSNSNFFYKHGFDLQDNCLSEGYKILKKLKKSNEMPTQTKIVLFSVYVPNQQTISRSSEGCVNSIRWGDTSCIFLNINDVGTNKEDIILSHEIQHLFGLKHEDMNPIDESKVNERGAKVILDYLRSGH